MIQSENFPIMSDFSLWQQRIWKLGSRYIWLLSLMTRPEISLLRKFWITGEAVFRYWIFIIFFLILPRMQCCMKPPICFEINTPWLHQKDRFVKYIVFLQSHNWRSQHRVRRNLRKKNFRCSSTSSSKIFSHKTGLFENRNELAVV